MSLVRIWKLVNRYLQTEWFGGLFGQILVFVGTGVIVTLVWTGVRYGGSTVGNSHQRKA